jgi:hypothetical protein
MAAPIPADLTEYVADGVPHSAQSVTLSVRIAPRTGAVAVYASPTDSNPAIQCKGPSQQITVGYRSGKFYIRMLPGTDAFAIKVVGWH